MSALVSLILGLLSLANPGHVRIVPSEAPTGPLERPDVLVEYHVPDKASCDHRGGIYIDHWCIGEDY